jgi:hypothetical protein
MWVTDDRRSKDATASLCFSLKYKLKIKLKIKSQLKSLRI